MTSTENGWIRRIVETEAKWGREKAMERARSMYCGLTLGREFGESVDDFAARKPEIAEFFTWFREYTA